MPLKFCLFSEKNQTHLNFPGMSLCAFKHEHFLKYWMFYTLWHIRIAIRQWFKGHPHLLDKVTHENLKLLYSLESGSTCKSEIGSIFWEINLKKLSLLIRTNFYFFRPYDFKPLSTRLIATFVCLSLYSFSLKTNKSRVGIQHKSGNICTGINFVNHYLQYRFAAVFWL